MTPTPDAEDELAVDTHRLRRMRQVLVAGSVVAVLLFLLAGLSGADGRDGLAILLLVLAAACAVSAAYGGVTLLVDDLRSHAISRRRIVSSLGLFVAAAVLMAMVAGVGG